MQDLADSLKSPVDQVMDTATTSRSLSEATTVNTHHRASESGDPEETDGMDGIEHISSAIGSGSADQTIVFKCPPSSYPTPPNGNYVHHPHHHHPGISGGYTRPIYTSQTATTPNDYQSTTTLARRQASSSHSRSSSLSIGSISQPSSSVYGDDYHLNSPVRTTGLKVHPSGALSSYASHPNFHPPPLRSTPVRRTFPSLRHAMSHPAFNSPASASSQAPSLPPMSASSSSSSSNTTTHSHLTGHHHHQYASFPPSHHPYAFSPFSAPPNQPFSSSTSPSSARNNNSHNNNNHRLELAPVCPSRVGHSPYHHFPHREDAIEWPTTDDYGVGFDEALGALETVMRFLQDQPTSFATPRDYMVVGELFGRMKEKKQEMLSIGGVNGNKGSSTNNGGTGSAVAPGLNINVLPRRLISSSGSSSNGGTNSNTLRTNRSSSQSSHHQHHTQQSQQQSQQQQQQQQQQQSKQGGLSVAISSPSCSSPGRTLSALSFVKEDCCTSNSDRMEH
ncbi:hypothetical protein VP01_210g18 [Puccinia sorghi]|uniref:Uncharacterized protein n=1 Tax=Puccinia sorghi TaxID=27349 RepID=A0A0L6VA97_9BASI|nr:hypothetical protein VP01_210g18 [Puccinia sorghi]